ncbi:MAG: hypothetical protein JNK65_01650 [Deltaproteobacteria bacterium]|nr:hypothetical protein [Deltaproteobacteria bacterium]
MAITRAQREEVERYIQNTFGNIPAASESPFTRITTDASPRGISTHSSFDEIRMTSAPTISRDGSGLIPLGPLHIARPHRDRSSDLGVLGAGFSDLRSGHRAHSHRSSSHGTHSHPAERRPSPPPVIRHTHSSSPITGPSLRLTTHFHRVYSREGSYVEWQPRYESVPSSERREVRRDRHAHREIATASHSHRISRGDRVEHLITEMTRHLDSAQLDLRLGATTRASSELQSARRLFRQAMHLTQSLRGADRDSLMLMLGSLGMRLTESERSVA